MPKISISSANRVKQYEAFPRLKLEAGEKALLSIHDDPTVVYVHTLRSPKIVNGKAEMETKERKDKSTYEAHVMDFVARPQCLGDEDTLAERGVDPKNCPACAVAKKNDSVDAPQLRYALPVFKYATKGDGWELAGQPGGQVVVWTFTVKMFNKLIEITEETENPLTENDLKLECINKVFQKYDIGFSVKAQWKKSANWKAFVEQALEDNQPEDLEGMCGRRMTRDEIQDHLDDINDAWRLANGQANEVSEADQASLKAALGDFMNNAGNSSSRTENSSEETSTSTEKAPGFAELMAMTQNK